MKQRQGVTLTLAGVVVLAGAGCGKAGGVEGPSLVEVEAPVVRVQAPSAWTEALVFGWDGEHRARLTRAAVGQCFELRVDEGFTKEERAVVGEAARAVEAASGVRFAEGCPSVVRVERATYDAKYAGVAYIEQRDYRVVGGRALINPAWVRSKVVMHELLHVVGLMHPGPGKDGATMSSQEIDAREVAGVDREALGWMMKQVPGMQGPWATSTTKGNEREVVFHACE